MPNGVTIEFNDLPRLIREMPDAAKNGVEGAAREGERYVKQSISDSPPTGRRYGTHVASSPGNPPRIDTSNLVNSINSAKKNDYLWQIRVGAEYGPILEFGGRYIAARPFMGPMADWLKKNADDIMAEFLRDAI